MLPRHNEAVGTPRPATLYARRQTKLHFVPNVRRYCDITWVTQPQMGLTRSPRLPQREQDVNAEDGGDEGSVAPLPSGILRVNALGGVLAHIGQWRRSARRALNQRNNAQHRLSKLTRVMAIAFMKW